MAAGKKDLVIEQGAEFALTITYKVSGALVDLTNYSAYMQVRETKDAAAAILDLSSAALGGIVLGGAAGTIAITVSGSADATPNTYDLDFDSAVYDLKLVDATGETIRLLEGTVTLNRQVTTKPVVTP